MPHKYTKEQVAFIKENITGTTRKELTGMFNTYFEFNLSVSQIISFVKNHKLNNGLAGKPRNKYIPIKYTEEQIGFIRENVTGTTRIDLANKFNNHFGSEITVSQITGLIKNLKLKNGLDGRFKPGTAPHNYLPVGSEVVNGEGYVVIKIAEPNKWKFKHVLIWEAQNGARPKGYAILFGDKNKSNFSIDNLILVSKEQLLILNHKKLIQNDADLTRTGVIIADLFKKIGDRKAKRKT